MTKAAPTALVAAAKTFMSLSAQSPIFLSICIPTRDRAQCLRELLESIAAQATPEVEIVISDDGSSDDTPQIIAEFRNRFPYFVSERHDPALRYDRNVLNVVAKASGDFCWLFGDDDKMEPGGLAAVIAALRANPDLTGLTTALISYDHTLKERIYVRELTQNETRLFTGAGEAFLKLLDRLGFLSCQIVNRARWQEVVTKENLEPYFAGYVQLYIVARMITRTPRWQFLAQKCVGFRSDNDSFRILGTLGRLKMDVCGYEQIVGDIFGRRSSLYHKAMAEIARTHARHHIVAAKRAGAPPSFSRGALLLCLKYYWRYSSFWLHTFPILALPRRPMLLIRGFYQRHRHD